MTNHIYMALSGETVHINFTVIQQANEAGGYVVCYSPSNSVLEKIQISENTGKIKTYTLILKNVKISESGKYRCEMQVSKVYWSLLVRGEL